MLEQYICNAKKTLKLTTKHHRLQNSLDCSGILFMSRGLVALEIKRFSGKPAGCFFDVEGFASKNTFLKTFLGEICNLTECE